MLNSSRIGKIRVEEWIRGRMLPTPMSPKLLRRAVRGLNLFLSGGTNTIPEPVFGRNQRGNVDRVGNRPSIDHEPDLVDFGTETCIKVVRYNRTNRTVSEEQQ